MFKRDLSYLTGILLICVLLWMLISGLIQLRFELHRFIYHSYGAYLLIILAVVHVFANWRKFTGFFKKKFRSGRQGAKGWQQGDIQNIFSMALILSATFTLVSGFLQVKLNFPRARFVYHIYSVYFTFGFALIHICLNLKKLNIYLKRRSPSIFLGPDRRSWRPSIKAVMAPGTGILIIVIIYMIIKWSLPGGQTGIESTSKYTARRDLEVAMKYHEETKHTYAGLMAKTARLDLANRPSVFKQYPRAELIKLSANLNFDSISVEEAIEKGALTGGFSGEPITAIELSRLLYYANGVTDELRYPGLTYYLRAAPSAGALYPTVIYLVVNNVAGLEKGIYHYSVKNHALHFLKEGDFSEELASYVEDPTGVKRSSVVFIMSTIFHRTKWKYGERGYRYALLDTGHVAGNLILTSKALNMGSYPMGKFVDDKINKLLEIDGIKEAVVYMNAVGKIDPSGDKSGGEDQAPSVSDKKPVKRLGKGFTISELLHENGKLDSIVQSGNNTSKKTTSYKSYPNAQKLYLPRDFSKQGPGLDEAIRRRRSVRDYSGKSISKQQLARLLYYSYGLIKDNCSRGLISSSNSLYPIEIYLVINNVKDIDRGVYHYNVPEHSLELLSDGDYRSKITKASLGQETAGDANIVIIQTLVLERVKPYGDRGYRYAHLDAGTLGESVYLEAVSMGLGVCGIGAFFDDQVNEILGVDEAEEFAIYLISVGSPR